MVHYTLNIINRILEQSQQFYEAEQNSNALKQNEDAIWTQKFI